MQIFISIPFSKSNGHVEWRELSKHGFRLSFIFSIMFQMGELHDKNFNDFIRFLSINIFYVVRFISECETKET